ncbi:MAG TPA: hypothetical protein VHO25_06980 [Polyangiaceae bacterium]|nr:hypothetical protein [Polyangiaceae bacterium]
MPKKPKSQLREILEAVGVVVAIVVALPAAIEIVRRTFPSWSFVVALSAAYVFLCFMWIRSRSKVKRLQREASETQSLLDDYGNFFSGDTWPQRLALKIDMMPTDFFAVTINKNGTVDVRVNLRVINRAPFRVRVVELAFELHASCTRFELRKQVTARTGWDWLHPGEEQIWAEELKGIVPDKMQPNPHPIATLKVYGKAIVGAREWGGEGKYDLYSWTYGTIQDETATNP